MKAKSIKELVRSHSDQIELVTNQLLSLIKSSLDHYGEVVFDDRPNLSFADEQMQSVYKSEGKYVLETTINRDGEPWDYDLCDTGRISVEDLLWIAEQLAAKESEEGA